MVNKSGSKGKLFYYVLLFIIQFFPFSFERNASHDSEQWDYKIQNNYRSTVQ